MSGFRLAACFSGRSVNSAGVNFLAVVFLIINVPRLKKSGYLSQLIPLWNIISCISLPDLFINSLWLNIVLAAIEMLFLAASCSRQRTALAASVSFGTFQTRQSKIALILSAPHPERL